MSRLLNVLDIVGFRKSYGPKTVLDGISLTVGENVKAGVIAIASAMTSAPPSEMKKLLKEQEELGIWIDHHGGWETDHRKGWIHFSSRKERKPQSLQLHSL